MTTIRKPDEQVFFNGALYGPADARVGRKVREWMRAHPAQVMEILKAQVETFDRHHGLSGRTATTSRRRCSMPTVVMGRSRC